MASHKQTPLYICVMQHTTSDSGKKILRQKCTIYWQSMCRISVKSLNANNSYSGFCEVTPKHVVSIFHNSLFNSDTVHGLLGNSAINFLALYLFSCFNSSIKAWSSAEIIILLLFSLLFMLIASTNVRHFRLSNCSSLCNAILGIKCAKFYSDLFRFDISIVQCLRVYFFTGHNVWLLCYVRTVRYKLSS